MSVSMNNLFNYSRALPEPFDKLANKKVKVTSKYGSATEATLSCTVIKAVHPSPSPSGIPGALASNRNDELSICIAG